MAELKNTELEDAVKKCYAEWVDWTEPGNLDLLPPCEMLENLVRIFKHFGHDIEIHIRQKMEQK